MLLRLAAIRTTTGDVSGAAADKRAAAAAAADTGDDRLAAACAEAAIHMSSEPSGERVHAPLHHRAIGSRPHA